MPYFKVGLVLGGLMQAMSALFFLLMIVAGISEGVNGVLVVLCIALLVGTLSLTGGVVRTVRALRRPSPL